MSKNNKPLDAVYKEIDTKNTNFYKKHIIEKPDHKIKSKWLLRVETLFMDYDKFGIKRIHIEFKKLYIPFKKRVMKEKEVTYKDCESVENELKNLLSIVNCVETSLINAQGFKNEKKKLILLNNLYDKKLDIIVFQKYLFDYKSKIDTMINMNKEPPKMEKEKKRIVSKRVNVSRGNENDTK